MKGRPLARRILWLLSAASLLTAVALAVTGLASVEERAAAAGPGGPSADALRADAMLLPFLLLGIGVFAAILAGVALHEPDPER